MEQKNDLLDMTFLIPVRIDSVIRIENLLASIKYILDSFNTKIFVLEAASYKNGILERLLPKNVDYTFVEDCDPIFYRTYYINVLVRKARTKFVGIWDSDIVIDIPQIIAAVQSLRNEYEVAFPYDGRFYDTTFIIRELFITAHDVSILKTNVDKMSLPYGHRANGGAIFINKEDYEKAGVENENFYGWAPEDVERKERFEKLGFKIFRAEGPLFYLSHPRDLNGKYRSEQQKKYGLYLLEQTRNSSESNIYSLKDLL